MMTKVGVNIAAQKIKGEGERERKKNKKIQYKCIDKLSQVEANYFLFVYSVSSRRRFRIVKCFDEILFHIRWVR